MLGTGTFLITGGKCLAPFSPTIPAAPFPSSSPPFTAHGDYTLSVLTHTGAHTICTCTNMIYLSYVHRHSLLNFEIGIAVTENVVLKSV